MQQLKQTNLNKNALSSVEPRLLGDKFYCQLVLLCYFFRLEYKSTVICHTVNT